MRSAPTLLSIVVAVALVTGACGNASPTSATATTAVNATTQPCGTVSGVGCAPEGERIDLTQPSFSNPAQVINPLHPTSNLHSAILLGNVEGVPFRVEVTLLPGNKIINWNGGQVAALESQYVAFLDGRIQEVALDWYAQADDGSVWYLGEDVFNYEDGVVADTDGTWQAGRDGPAAMIMPAAPQVGDVYRPENIPGLVFEEVAVKSIGLTVAGPQGPVAGAIAIQELHMDGSHEDKTFAPGYGEFSTGNGSDLEAVALAVPTDALSGPAPSELETLSGGAVNIFDTAQSEDWDGVAVSLGAMTTAWEAYRANSVPPMLDAQMSDALASLAGAVDTHNSAEASQAALDVAGASLDFQLRYRPPTEIDAARFGLWVQQVSIDVAADDSASVKGDVATLEWIQGRFAHTLDSAVVSDVDALLDDLRAAADAENLAAAADAATRLRKILAGLKPAS